MFPSIRIVSVRVEVDEYRWCGGESRGAASHGVVGVTSDWHQVYVPGPALRQLRAARPLTHMPTILRQCPASHRLRAHPYSFFVITAPLSK